MLSRKSIVLFTVLTMSLLMGGAAWGAAVEIRIADGADDAEQHLDDGRMDIGSSDLEMPYEDAGSPTTDEQVLGLRFVAVPIEPSDLVTEAYIEIEVDKVDKEGSLAPVNLIIEGELSLDAPAFTDVTNNITDRPTTTAKVMWTLPEWTEQDAKFQSPDLSAIIEEIVAQEGWASGNAIVLIVRDDKDNPSTGLREAESYDGEADAAALLRMTVVGQVDIRIADGGDDAEQHLDDGRMDIGSSDLEMPYEDAGNPATDEQVLGLRFLGIPLDPGAAVMDAYIEIEVDKVDKEGSLAPVNLIVEGELALDAPPIADVANNLTDRPTTAAKVMWSLPEWTEQDAKFQSPDLSAIIEEIVAQEGWASGNAIVLIIRDDKDNPSTGLREAESYDGEADAAPLLHITGDLTVVKGATEPDPADGAGCVLVGSTLSWTPSSAGVVRDVYFGTSDPPLLVSTQEETSYVPESMEAGTTYYWYVDEVDADGNVLHTGHIWSFTTTNAVIASQNDDGEDHIAYGEIADDGAEGLGSSDLEMPWDGDDYQVIGLRFANLSIPKGTPISGAHVQFTADDENLDGGPVNLIVSGLLMPDTGELVEGENFFDDRTPKTMAEVLWTDIPEWTSGQATDASRTPDISSIIQEIVNQDDWASGNAIMLFVRDDEANPSADNRSALSGNAVLHVPLSTAAAIAPSPSNGAENVPVDDGILHWVPGLSAVSHTVYLSTDVVVDDTDFLGTIENASDIPVALVPGVTYYWRVDATDADLNITPGVIWHFTTVPGEAAYMPYPANGGVWHTGVDTELSWKSGVGDLVVHHVYFSDDPALVEARDPSVETLFWPVNTFMPGALTPGTTYYWAVDEFTGSVTTPGPTWSFTAMGE